MTAQGIDIHKGTTGHSQFRDARVVALRWDLWDSALVLDLDSPTSESRDRPYRRTWAVFDGVTDLSMPLMTAVRVTKGLWSSDDLRCVAQSPNAELFALTLMMPHFDGQSLSSCPHLEVEIAAARVLILSSRSSTVSRSGLSGLENELRQGLATDAEMLASLRSWQG